MLTTCDREAGTTDDGVGKTSDKPRSVGRGNCTDEGVKYSWLDRTVGIDGFGVGRCGTLDMIGSEGTGVDRAGLLEDGSRPSRSSSSSRLRFRPGPKIKLGQS